MRGTSNIVQNGSMTHLNRLMKGRSSTFKESIGSLNKGSYLVQKLREVVKDQTFKFTQKMSNTNGSEASSQITEMQTLLVHKDLLDESDLVKKDYFNTILIYQNECIRHFHAKNREKTMESLSKLAETASYAYDLEILKEASFL